MKESKQTSETFPHGWEIEVQPQSQGVILLAVGLFFGLAIGLIVFFGLPKISASTAPGPITVATNAPVSDQSDVNIADVKPVALADISGNIADGQPAPDFTVRTMGGGQFALKDHAGQPTLMMFSASWCGSCIYEAKNLAQVYAQYKERGLNVVVLDTQDGDTDADLQAFRETAGNPDYVWAFDDQYAVTQAYKVRTLDTTVLIDQAGNIVYYDQRPTPLEPLLQAAMAVLP